MEPEPVVSRRPPLLLRMEEQDRVSQASSVASISYLPLRKDDGKVQTFGKRCHSAKRDPNCSVVIRGWLYKKDSSGLKLWKRRWFVLSDYCLFYYKDSREESVLGSIPLPSYKILFCSPRECKNKKFTFKVVHQGMRSYFFSADTQEDMLGWVRALSQSAAMEPDCTMNRRCSSFQDFTHIGGSSESVDMSPSDGEGHCHVSRTLSEPGHLSGGRMVGPRPEPRGRRSVRHRNTSPAGRTPSPLPHSRRRVQDESLLRVHADLSSRALLGSRPHTPVGRVDIRPQDDSVLPQSLYYAPASPQLEFKSTPTTPVTERWQKPVSTYGSVHVSNGRRALGKSFSTGTNAELLPPLPPSSRALSPPQHHHHHHHHHRNHLSVCVLPPATPEPRDGACVWPPESDADVVLTRLCGCDKLLQSLSLELGQLQVDKDSVHCALEVSRLQLDDWKNQGPQLYEDIISQKALLQDDLVTIRARMCDVSLEMEKVWVQYERMESELSVIRSHLQHVCNFGVPEEQSQAQRELWMMEDILSGLKTNREHFRFLLGLQRHHMFQSPVSPMEIPPSEMHMDLDPEPPARPPLPQDLGRDQAWTQIPFEGVHRRSEAAPRRGSSQPDLLHVNPHAVAPDPSALCKGKTPDLNKTRMSEEEQIERLMKRSQHKMLQRQKLQNQEPTSQTQDEVPFPLRVTRVVTAVLPSSLVARKVSVEDPPPEMDVPLPEQIPPEDGEDPGAPGAATGAPGAAGASATEPDAKTNQDPGGSHTIRCEQEERRSGLFASEPHPDLCLSPEQREAKLRRVERIRERVIRSAVRESSSNQLPTLWREDSSQGDTAKRQRPTRGREADDKTKSSKCHKPEPSSQDTDEGQLSKSKSPGSGKTTRAVAKTKVRRPASPYHVSSLSSKSKQEPKLEDDIEGGFSSTDARAKWFLSSGQWQGLTTPRILETATETRGEVDGRGASLEESDEMSPEVCESLEKMRENHALFYKIACDISISDSDIARNDGSAGMQTIAEELLITEDGEGPNAPLRPCPEQQNEENAMECEENISVNRENQLQDDENKDMESRDMSSDNGGALEENGNEEAVDETNEASSFGDAKTEGNVGDNETDCINGRSLDRSGSIGKTRVTVLRTSL